MASSASTSETTPVFSGRFVQDTETGTPKYSGMTKIGKLLDPEFIFRFSSVKAPEAFTSKTWARAVPAI